MPTVEQTKLVPSLPRPQIERRIEAALAVLDPGGVAEGGLLARYCHYQAVQDIPLCKIGGICKGLEEEPGILAHLGEAKYFDTVTAGAKLGLYRAALAEMEEMLATMGQPLDAGMTWRDFRRTWNACIKNVPYPPPMPEFLVEIPPKMPGAKRGENVGGNSPENDRQIDTPSCIEKQQNLEGQVVSKNNKSCPGKKTRKPAARKAKKPTSAELAAVKTVVQYLNQKTGRSYRPTSASTQRHILARLREGHSLDDLCRVVDDLNIRWNRPPLDGAPDMRPYLRPETMFGCKFEGYLNDARMDGHSLSGDILEETTFNPIKSKGETHAGKMFSHAGEPEKRL